MLHPLGDKVMVSGQLAAGDVASLAARGVTMIVNNRPDGEDTGQPAGVEIEAAAKTAGIDYRHVPMVRGIGPGEVGAMHEAIDAAGEGRVLAYCRSGMRSALVCALAFRDMGVARDEVISRLNDAGFDPSPIDHLL